MLRTVLFGVVALVGGALLGLIVAAMLAAAFH